MYKNKQIISYLPKPYLENPEEKNLRYSAIASLLFKMRSTLVVTVLYIVAGGTGGNAGKKNRFISFLYATLLVFSGFNISSSDNSLIRRNLS